MARATDLQLLRGATMERDDNVVQVSHFFFADNTLIFCQPEVRNLIHLRCVLLCFQTVSGLNINLSKSELVRTGDIRDENYLANIMGCKAVKLPIKYKDKALGNQLLTVLREDLKVGRGTFYQKEGDSFLSRAHLPTFPLIIFLLWQFRLKWQGEYRPSNVAFFGVMRRRKVDNI